MKDNMYQKMDPIKNKYGKLVGPSIKQKLNVTFKFTIKDSAKAYLPPLINPNNREPKSNHDCKNVTMSYYITKDQIDLIQTGYHVYTIIRDLNIPYTRYTLSY